LAGASLIEPEMAKYLNSSNGWYGVITEREFTEDRCLTVKTEQQTLIESYFGDKVKVRKGHKGRKNLQKIGIPATSPFRLASTDSLEELVLLYPKKKGNELRLYFKQGVFAPRTGDRVYIYMYKGILSLAVFDSNTVNSICRNVGDRLFFSEGKRRLEEELDDYQLILNQRNVPKQVLTQSYAWQRNPQIARDALIESGFKCELMPQIEVFTSKSTMRPFMEVHHLIPMKQQSRFEISLDVLENLCVLNPLAHRLVHHAVFEELEPYLEALYSSRKVFLESVGYSLNELKTTYQ